MPRLLSEEQKTERLSAYEHAEDLIDRARVLLLDPDVFTVSELNKSRSALRNLSNVIYQAKLRYVRKDEA